MHSGMRLASMACVALPTCGLALAESQRYLPTLNRFKDLPAPDGEAASDACAYVFTTDPFGKEGEFHCPYDRAAGSPFCSMCKLVVEQLANA